mmetsp:Transcript_14102/g.30087  ORF Transcript_14102/g.30087 Transcript_14102/m.30087 type:complete len:93 (+) Transcript_14102:1094-1372(+)
MKDIEIMGQSGDMAAALRIEKGHGFRADGVAIPAAACQACQLSSTDQPRQERLNQMHRASNATCLTNWSSIHKSPSIFSIFLSARERTVVKL